jgi:hypothetical protein
MGEFFISNLIDQAVDSEQVVSPCLPVSTADKRFFRWFRSAPFAAGFPRAIFRVQRSGIHGRNCALLRENDLQIAG